MATVNPERLLTPSDCAWLATRTVYLALSGGIDSVVLAHLLYRANIPFTAIHINHQLHVEAAQWQAFCEQFCQQLGVDIITESVFIDGENNLEGKARKARYEAITAVVDPDAVVCFAHHQSDLAETFLLQLKRGSGANGLTSLRRMRRMEFGDKAWTAFRPILDITKRDVLTYAHLHELKWVDDPSNTSMAHERNIIRHHILQPLQQHWPDIESRIAHTVDMLAHEHTLLNQVCDERLGQCLTPEKRLNLTQLANFTEAWQKQIIRHYCLTYYRLNLSQAQLYELMKICWSRDDAQGTMRLAHYELRRYQGNLYILAEDELQVRVKPSNLQFEWQVQPVAVQTSIVQPIENTLMVPLPVEIDAQEVANLQYTPVALSYRIKPFDAPHSKTLKQWLHSENIPPWHRQPCFLITHRDTPIAVVCPRLALVLSKQNTHSMRITFSQ